MLNPKPESNSKIGKMTAEKRARYRQAVAEEEAGKRENVLGARDIAKRLKGERKQIAGLVAQLREIRQAGGVSLSELESRTGISKSSLSRLENSVAPNPTLLTLHRYAAAMGVVLKHDLIVS